MTCIPTTHLTPPAISPLHIKDTITCIRAHRERLFRVDTEWINGKLICHNYGQGGAGWTFLFGCVHESLRLFLEQAARTITLKHQPICVIGAGCYGLLTAIMLARAGYRVRIVAKECDNLPSHNAAGFFFPRARKSSTEHERAIFQARGLESYAAYLQIINDQHPFIAQGAHLLPAYYGLDIDPGFAPYIAQGLMTPPQQTTITFGTSTSYGAMKYQTLFMNATALMAELHRNIVELGITIASAEVQEFSEIPEPIIFNCAGLGAKKLAHDTRVIPVQGHLITLKNQPAGF
jgi:D-amino-acid oxidase